MRKPSPLSCMAAGFAICALLLAAHAAAQDAAGGLTGVVIDSVTRQPVRKAIVSINAAMLQEPSANPTVPPPSLTTGASGTFAVNSLRPGRYLISVQHPNYPQTPSIGVHKSVLVKSGETTGPFAVELIPGAIVSGHIVDEDGDPLTGCSVSAFSGKSLLRMGFGSAGRQALSDDGGFRLYELPPGKYILSAQCFGSVFQPRPLSSGDDPPPSSAYPKQFYPGANTAEFAQTIELAPGTERSGIDFQMRPVPVTHVHVTLAPGDWKGRKDLAWSFLPVGQPAANRFNGMHPLDGTKDAFNIPKIFPGSYKLVIASTLQPGNNSQPTTAIGMGAVQLIDVKDKPVELTLELRHAVDLHGVVELESNAPNQVALSQLQIQLTSEDLPFYLASVQTALTDNGVFTIRSVLPDMALLRVTGPNCFLKSAYAGGNELIDRRLDLSSGPPGELRLLVSTNTATLRGTAPAGMTVMLEQVLEQVKDSLQNFRGAQVDPNGQFKIDGLAPGEYRVRLTDQPAPFSGEAGQNVTLQEGQTLVMELKVTELKPDNPH